MQTNASGATAWVIVYKNMANPALAGVSSGVATALLSFTPPNLTTTAANTTVISLVGIHTPLAGSPCSAHRGSGSKRPCKKQRGARVGAPGVADRFAAAAWAR